MVARAIGVIFFLFVFLLSVRVVQAAPELVSSHEGQEDLKQEKYPIHLPEYQGVDQLLTLSSKWLVVVTSNSSDVVKEIDKMTKGEYSKYVKIWEDSLQKNQPNWVAKRNYVDKMLGEHFGEARLNAGEKLLDQPDYFSITSKEDENYTVPKHPMRTTRFIPALGEGKIAKTRVPGNIDIHYAHYSYIELPFPLKNGYRYTIQLGNGKQVDFLYDELKTVSRAIKVNQVGYLPQAPKKYAYLSGYLHEFGPMDFSDVKVFYVVNAVTGDVVYEGEVKLRAANPRFSVDKSGQDSKSRPLISGEDIYEMDFTPLQDEGEFFISIPGVGRSWTFRHSIDAYGPAFYTTARALYHQRSGMEINSRYSAWERPAYHTEPVYESQLLPIAVPISKPSNYNRFDVVGATIDKTKQTEDATGGWYDAADWDKNLMHYIPVFDLMYAYELKPDHFTEGQLNLPESQNGIPDILDEAEYGILVWKKSQTEEGAVAGAVETWTHPSRDDPKYSYAYSLRTRWSSLLYAGAAAQYAYLVRPFDSKKAEEYAQSAMRAYAYGIDPKHSIDKMVIKAKTNRGSGEEYDVVVEEKELEQLPFRIHAATRLYMYTGDGSYLDGLAELLKKTYKPYDWPFSFSDYSPWMYYSLVFGKPSENLPKTVVSQWRQRYLDAANKLVGFLPEQPYRISWPPNQDYWMGWGATAMTNRSRALLIAYNVTSDEKYLNAALQNISYMLGTNPLGMSWTTGLGFVYPIEIQHELSEVDKIMDPIPGITIYGITGGGYPKKFQELLWEPNGIEMMSQANRNLPVWRNWAPHPHLNVAQNEFTIQETISSSIFCYAMLLPDGWMPSEKLKQRKPRRDELLFGYWFLP